MPTLDWIGKAAVVNYYRKVGYHLLRCDRELWAGDADAGNLLVQGDNLLTLKALLPYYFGKAKCIYIDPPDNTGNENWVYNDIVNSPGNPPVDSRRSGATMSALCRGHGCGEISEGVASGLLVQM